jgi:hypothetical protein
MRFREFLRVSVLLSGGAATALAAVTLIGANEDGDVVLGLIAAGWWALAVLIGLVLGRRESVSDGIGRLLASARTATSLPELEPGAVLFNRMWPLAVFALVAGVIGFFLPQVPGIATGYAILLALTARNQHRAVQAIEERDGVQYWFDRTPPLSAPRLVRTPGLRRIEPSAYADEGEISRFRSRSSSTHERVLATRSGVSQARRAVATPYEILCSVSTPWASESTTSVTPASAAARASVSGRSRRFGFALISRKVPVRAAASITRSVSRA